MTTHPSSRPQDDAAELDEAIGLLHGALAQAWPPGDAAPAAALRERLFKRVASSAAQHRGLITVRRGRATALELAAGVTARTLYRSATPTALRPGEPLVLTLLELAPGATLSAGLGLAGQNSEWLVVRGACAVDGLALATLDQHSRAGTPGEPTLTSDSGATVYLRNGGSAALRGGISRARDAVWEKFAPGIQRRIIWSHGDEACYVARAAAGALVPAHGHHLDEECLMLEGDLFLGDILLRAGEFQLAPMGIEHGIVQAATDTLLYVRGDIAPAVDLLQ